MIPNLPQIQTTRLTTSLYDMEVWSYHTIFPNIPGKTEITEHENKFLEQVMGSLLYYGTFASLTALKKYTIYYLSNFQPLV